MSIKTTKTTKWDWFWIHKSNIISKESQETTKKKRKSQRIRIRISSCNLKSSILLFLFICSEDLNAFYDNSFLLFLICLGNMHFYSTVSNAFKVERIVIDNNFFVPHSLLENVSNSLIDLLLMRIHYFYHHYWASMIVTAIL